jgi:hypothetical protein
MIGASNSLISIQLIERSNQMDYLLVLVVLDFMIIFSKSNDLSMSLTTLCTRSMIAFACAEKVVNCSWFGFNAVIVYFIHLFEPPFELA